MASYWETHNPGQTHWEGAAGEYLTSKDSPWNKKMKKNMSGSYVNATISQKLKKADTSKATWDSGQVGQGGSGYKRIGNEKDSKLLGMRKAAFEQQFYSQKGMKAWQGNEWMKKALDQAWEKDEFNIRGIYGGKFQTTTSTSVGDGDYDVKTVGGYGQMQPEDIRQLTHTYAAKAQEMFSSAQQAKETERMLSARRARGGMGSRGSTLLTGGREGVLAEANVKKKTLIGAEG